MKINRLNSISLRLTYWPHCCFVLSVFFFKPASHPQLNAQRVRTEPEGQSSPLGSDRAQRMESAEKTDVEHGLNSRMTAASLSSGSPASSVLRSKHKEGNRNQSLSVCYYFTLNAVVSKLEAKCCLT